MPREHGVHGVSRGPRHLGDDHPLFAQQTIDERRLAGVGTADDGHGRFCGGAGLGGRAAPLIVAVVVFVELARSAARLPRQPLDDLVEQIADALSVLGAHLDDRIEPELVQLQRSGLGAPIVGLVDGEDRRNIGAANRGGNFLVARRPALRGRRRQTRSPSPLAGPAARARRRRGGADPRTRRTSRRCRSVRNRNLPRPPDASGHRGSSRGWTSRSRAARRSAG